MMQFDLPQDESSIIKVIGVGGGGSNAVNHMFRQGIKGVEFIVCNTDQQSLDVSPVPTKIVLGESLTHGRGAGAIPEVGKNAAIESIEELKVLLTNTEMLFITAGLGGGTGTGAAPIIAAAAKEMGILTVGIVTVPFSFEGKKRKIQADEGLDALKQNVDTLLVISNDKLREIYGNLKVTDAFGHADDILSTAARGIAEIITTTLQINTDINDVKTVMKDSGVAIMGSAQASGENRATLAVEQALASPLLNDNNITGARYVLVNIMCGEDEITMDELGEITDYIQDSAGMTAEIIKGYGVDANLGDSVSVTIIATGFNMSNRVEVPTEKVPEKTVYQLDEPEVEDKKEQPTNNNPITTPAPSTQPTEFIEPSVSNEPELKRPTKETPPVTFEFEVNKQTQPSSSELNEPVLKEKSVNNELDPNPSVPQNDEEQTKRAQERINTISKLKDLSFKIKTQNGLSELENEPAYKRRNIDIEDTPHSSESQISRFTLSKDENADDDKTELRQNNSFLHDNVD